MMPIAEIGPVFIVANTGIDQNDVLRSSDNKGMQTHHQQVRFRVKKSGSQPVSMFVNDRLVQIGKENMQGIQGAF